MTLKQYMEKAKSFKKRSTAAKKIKSTSNLSENPVIFSNFNGEQMKM